MGHTFSSSGPEDGADVDRLRAVTSTAPAAMPASRLAGRVIAWGDNTAGQASVPPGLTDVVAVAAGGRHSLALHGDGHITA